MTYFEIQKHGKKIKVRDYNDDGDDVNQEQVVFYDFWDDSHGFWNEAPDDLLVEIFVRHPDWRSALRASAVCRRWRSLISDNPRFIKRFKSHHQQHHQDRYPPEFLPWAITFRNNWFCEPQHFRTIGQLYSKEWLFLYEKLSANYLDFLPSPMVIKASCNDLLFVSPSSRRTDDHYICNPITKQNIQLPPIPSIYEGDMRAAIGYTLVRMPVPGPSPTPKIRFKVVEVLPPYDYPRSLDLNIEPNTIVPVTIFCSESRKWEIRSFPCPGFSTSRYDNLSTDIVTCNGILYWVGTSGNRNSVIYLDLTNEKCGAIDILSGNIDLAHRIDRIGVVPVSGGVHELRLLQADMRYRNIVHLKVWRLINDNNWFLVHNIKLERPNYFYLIGVLTDEAPRDVRDCLPCVGPFFHPTNGDLVFIVWGIYVVEYNLINARYEKMGKLREKVSWLNLTTFHISRGSNLADADL